jgi:hypothetical protein
MPCACGLFLMDRHVLLLNELSYDRKNLVSDSGILDITGPIAFRGPDIDHRIKLDPLIVRQVRVKVDTPEISLNRAVVNKGRFLVGLHVAANRHDATIDVDHRLDKITELAGGDAFQLTSRDSRVNNFDHAVTVFMVAKTITSGLRKWLLLTDIRYQIRGLLLRRSLSLGSVPAIRKNLVSDSGILDITGPIAFRGPDIDHRIKLDPH